MKVTALFFLLSVCCFLVSCGDETEKRTYTEITREAPQPKASRLEDPHAFLRETEMNMGQMSGMAVPAEMGAEVRWEVPPGWSEEKGTGIRLATFTAVTDSGPVECSVVSLGGRAGGLEANVARWLGQLDIPVPPGEKLAAFLDRQERFQSRGGFPVVLVDFTALQGNMSGGAESMVAAVVELEDARLFIKLTGSRDAVKKEYQALKDLCLSLESFS